MLRWDLRPWRPPVGPDENRVMTQRELEDLSPDECFQLLAAAQIGRLVYQDDLGPLAVPVNYAMAGHDIVFRVEGGAKRAAMQQPMLAFEVDHVDEERKFGWSVLVRGVGAEVDLERVPALLRAMDGHSPTPWAVGIHKVWLRLCRTPSPGAGSVRRSCRGDSNASKTGMKAARLSAGHRLTTSGLWSLPAASFRL